MYNEYGVKGREGSPDTEKTDVLGEDMFQRRSSLPLAINPLIIRGQGRYIALLVIGCIHFSFSI